MNYCMGCFEELTAGAASRCPCGFDESAYEQSGHRLPLRTVLYGKYMVGRVLGEGGFGLTYMGIELNLGIKMAIKEYYPVGVVTREQTQGYSVVSLAGDARTMFEMGRDRFLDEARRLARFRSLPGIVSVNDFFLENGTAYIAMDYIEGTTFKAFLAESGGKLPDSKVYDMMKPLMTSLTEVHSGGIIHRDISPDNIMFDSKGQVQLIDFGAARDFAQENKSLSVVLKPGFAPPEQYSSKGKQGPWTDVYALCATMYRAIAGSVPPEAVDRIIEDTIEPMSALGAEVDTAREAVVMKGLAVRAEDRLQSMDELREGLFESPTAPVATVPVAPAPPVIPAPVVPKAPAPVQETPAKTKKPPLAIWLGGAAAVVVIIAVVLFLILGGGEPHDAESDPIASIEDGGRPTHQQTPDPPREVVSLPPISVELTAGCDNGGFFVSTPLEITQPGTYMLTVYTSGVPYLSHIDIRSAGARFVWPYLVDYIPPVPPAWRYALFQLESIWVNGDIPVRDTRSREHLVRHDPATTRGDINPMYGRAWVEFWNAWYITHNQLADVDRIPFTHEHDDGEFLAIPGVPEIHSISVTFTVIAEGEPIALPPPREVVHIDLEWQGITDQRLADMVAGGEIPANTTILYLGGNYISDLTPLASLPYLQYAILWRNPIHDLAPVHGLTHLSVLYLLDTPVTLEEIERAQATMPNTVIIHNADPRQPPAPEPTPAEVSITPDRNVFEPGEHITVTIHGVTQEMVSGLAWVGLYGTDAAHIDLRAWDSLYNVGTEVIVFSAPYTSGNFEIRVFEYTCAAGDATVLYRKPFTVTAPGQPTAHADMVIMPQRGDIVFAQRSLLDDGSVWYTEPATPVLQDIFNGRHRYIVQVDDGIESILMEFSHVLDFRLGSRSDFIIWVASTGEDFRIVPMSSIAVYTDEAAHFQWTWHSQPRDALPAYMVFGVWNPGETEPAPPGTPISRLLRIGFTSSENVHPLSIYPGTYFYLYITRP